MGDEAFERLAEARGAVGSKAKSELGWTLHHPTWREGFAASYASIRTD